MARSIFAQHHEGVPEKPRGDRGAFRGGCSTPATWGDAPRRLCEDQVSLQGCHHLTSGEYLSQEVADVRTDIRGDAGRGRGPARPEVGRRRAPSSSEGGATPTPRNHRVCRARMARFKAPKSSCSARCEDLTARSRSSCCASVPRAHRDRMSAPREGAVRASTRMIPLVRTSSGRSGQPGVLGVRPGLTRNGRDFDHVARFSRRCLSRRLPRHARARRSDWLRARGLQLSGVCGDLVALMRAAARRTSTGSAPRWAASWDILASMPGSPVELVMNDVGLMIPAAAIDRIGR